MKRFLFASIFLSFLAFSTFANPFSVSFFTQEKPEISLFQRFEYNFMHDSKYENSGFSTIGVVDANELLIIGGINANSSSSDIAFQVFYAPCFWDFFSIGVDAKYHYYKYSDIFAEHNFLPGSFVRFNINNEWNLYFNLGSLFKFSIINSYPENILINDKTLFFNTGFIFSPFSDLNIFFDIGNSSLFEDDLLGVIQINTGASYKIWEHFSFGTDIFLKWEDASAPHDSFSQIGIRVNWGVLF